MSQTNEVMPNKIYLNEYFVLYRKPSDTMTPTTEYVRADLVNLNPVEEKPLPCPHCGSELYLEPCTNGGYRHPAERDCLHTNQYVAKTAIKLWNRRSTK